METACLVAERGNFATIALTFEVADVSLTRPQSSAGFWLPRVRGQVLGKEALDLLQLAPAFLARLRMLIFAVGQNGPQANRGVAQAIDAAVCIMSQGRNG